MTLEKVGIPNSDYTHLILVIALRLREAHNGSEKCQGWSNKNIGGKVNIAGGDRYIRYTATQASVLVITQSYLRAGDGIRTREYQLGRLMPYHLATPARTNTLTLILGRARSLPGDRSGLKSQGNLLYWQDNFNRYAVIMQEAKKITLPDQIFQERIDHPTLQQIAIGGSAITMISLRRCRPGRRIGEREIYEDYEVELKSVEDFLEGLEHYWRNESGRIENLEIRFG